jgi:hypothetical protein
MTDNTKASLVYNENLVMAEERETHILVDHYGKSFSVYTTNKRMGNHLLAQFPDTAVLSKDQASVSLDWTDLSLITKLHLSKLKPAT